jgi:hypothetical protein
LLVRGWIVRYYLIGLSGKHSGKGLGVWWGERYYIIDISNCSSALGDGGGGLRGQNRPLFSLFRPSTGVQSAVVEGLPGFI